MRRLIIFALMAALCQVIALGQSQAVPPELPRVFLDTAMPARTGITIIVGANESLQNAFDVSRPGDEIVYTAGVSKTGNFTLPVKTGNGWVIVRTSDMAGLPAEGTRATASNAAAMPKILTPNNGPAITTAPGAHHYRFVGVEFGISAGVNANSGIVNLGDGGSAQNSLSAVPHDLVIDRCYIHGNQTGNVSRGVTLNSASTAIIDSYISNCHGVGFDTQAVCGWNGPGPFKIVNNYLEGAGENVMFGGADPKIQNLIPSDIEFRRNTLSKPLSWKQGEPTYAGTPWSVKNLFELKNAQRVLIDGNLLEYCWVDAQVGYAIQFTCRNQEGTAPWSVVQDVTFTNNIVRHSGAGINVLGRDDNHPSGQAARILVQNNLFDDIGAARWGGNGRFLQITEAADVTLNHNTIFHTYNVITAYGIPSTGFSYTNNLSPHNQYGVAGDNTSPGNAAINTFFPGSLFSKNILAGGTPLSYPTNNFFPPDLDAVGFVDLAGGNYRLAANSLYKNAGSDGKDLGADIDAILSAIAGEGSPTPPPPPPPPTPPPPPPPPADTTGPVISNVRVTSVTGEGFTVAYTSNEPAAVAIEFGRTTAFGYTKAFPTSLLFSNSIVVDVLSSKSTFYIRLVARDQAGNESRSATFSVTTRPK